VDTDLLAVNFRRKVAPAVSAALGPRRSSEDNPPEQGARRTTNTLLSSTSPFGLFRMSVRRGSAQPTVYKTRQQSLRSAVSNLPVEPLYRCHDNLTSYGFAPPAQSETHLFRRVAQKKALLPFLHTNERNMQENPS
jgi:hypothetical protein